MHQPCFALLLVTITLVCADSRCITSADINFSGNDLQDAGVAATADACCQTCKMFPGCKFFTWNGEPGGNQHCWLKKSDAGKTPQTGVISKPDHYG